MQFRLQSPSTRRDQHFTRFLPETDSTFTPSRASSTLSLAACLLRPPLVNHVHRSPGLRLYLWNPDPTRDVGLPDLPPPLPSPPTSAMIFSSSRFSFSNSLDFSSSLLLVEDPVFMVSCASDCHSPRVISLRIWERELGVWMSQQGLSVISSWWVAVGRKENKRELGPKRTKWEGGK